MPGRPSACKMCQAVAQEAGSVQVYDVAGRPEPRVKASQCFTKYRWRAESAAGAGGAAIVATQVQQKSTLRKFPCCCMGPNSVMADESAAVNASGCALVG